MRHSASVLLNRILARGTFRHMQVVLRLAELGSVQRTAEAIGITQPSVTQALASLEKLLEVQLFERHSRGVRPTDACLELLPAVRQVFQGAAHGAEAIAARGQHGSGSLRLLASGSAMNGLLLDRIREFCRAFPSVQVQTREAEGDDLLLVLARNEADFAVCRRPGALPQGWTFEQLVDDRLAVICDPGHPLARRRRLQWGDVANETWVLSPAGSLARDGFDAIAAAHFPSGARTYPVVTRGLTLICSLLRQEQVLGFVPLSFVRHLIDARELCELPVSPGVDLPGLGLLAPAAGLREAPAALLSFLRKALAS